MRLAPDSGGFFVGDYVGLAATGATFTPLFPVTLNEANPADTLATTVRRPFGTPPSTQAPLGPPGHSPADRLRVPGRLPTGAERMPLR